jgi:hypothetical protein
VSGYLRTQFYHPSARGVGGAAIYRGQYEFVEAIQRVAGEVPLALTERLGVLTAPFDLDRIDSEIASWRSKYNLSEPWIIDIAVDMYQWGGPAADEWLHKRFYGHTPLSVEPLWATGVPSGKFTFEHPGLNLAHDGTLVDLTRQVRHAFEMALAKFEADIRERAYAEGWKDVPAQRQPPHSKQVSSSVTPNDRQAQRRRRSDTRHYDWLARFQCLGRSAAHIAKQYGLEPHTVAEAITKTAKVIGLTPRTGGKRGRPRKPTGANKQQKQQQQQKKKKKKK